jgi:hypothetical protein
MPAYNFYVAKRAIMEELLAHLTELNAKIAQLLERL